MRTACAVWALAVLAAMVPAAADAARARTWYVRAPHMSLAQVEQASRPGDRIVVLPSAQPLDGGIRLKPRQQLIGAG